MNSRGIMSFNLGGIDFDFVPSFENLERLESATQKAIYTIGNNPKLSDAIKCLLTCSVSKYADKPTWFNPQGIFEKVASEKKQIDICIFLATFCVSVLTAGSETDIKTVGASEEDEKK